MFDVITGINRRVKIQSTSSVNEDDLGTHCSLHQRFQKALWPHAS